MFLITTKELQLFGFYAKMNRPLLNEVNAMLAEYRLFNSQWTILKLLLQEGASTPAEIAARQQVEKPSVTKILQRLVELQYVEVRPGEDRREKWMRLTDKGTAVCNEIMGKLHTFYAGLLENVEENEIDVAISVLERIYENLKMKE